MERGWDQSQFYPHPMGPPSPHPPPPGPFGFYPHPPPPPPQQQGYPHPPPPSYHQGQRPGIRPRGGGYNGGRARQAQPTAQVQRGWDPRPKTQLQQKEEDSTQANQQQKVDEEKLPSDKALNIICYNCGDQGHFSAACTRPKVCFICFKKDHQADSCPRWKEPIVPAEFLGSASVGLGFFHVNVEPKHNRFKLWSGYDNCCIFTVEKGSVDQEGIISHLKLVFDKDWFGS